jgi:large subunit ribosomal protein L17
MRHHNANRKLGRERNQRRALLRSLAVSLVEKGRIKTTEAKAKELRPFIEKAVTKAKENTLGARRHVITYLNSESASKKLIEDIAPKYSTRNGGYTRITKTDPRKADASKMSYIEFV